MLLRTVRSVVVTAVVALLVGGLGATPVAPATPVSATATPATTTPATTKAASPVTIRVLTYNIHFGSYGLGRVARDIRRTGADVVLLNEIDDRTSRGGVHQARWLAGRLGMRFVYDANSPMPPGVRGNAVLTSYDVRGVRRLDLPWPPRSQRRGVMQVRLATRGLTFDVWVTHLNPGGGTFNQARGVKAAVGDPTCATVVGGDMNAGPGSREDRVLRTHLRDVWRDLGHGRGPTNLQGDNRIDYLYVDGLTPRRAWRTARGGSDHLGVVGDLRLDPRSSCG